MDKVSVIVPVYKVEAYLERCVKSLLGQTYKEIEIILVDDGSPDNSGALCDMLAAHDNRIRVVHQTNQGVSAARNHGLDAVTGQWVCFCDGDDWYEPDYLEQMLDCAKNENADYIICDYQIVSEGRAAAASGSVRGFSTGCDRRMVIACGPVSSCTHMIRSTLFAASGVRYPVGCRQYEELPVIPALAKFASRIGVVDKPLYNYFQRGDGTSASNTAQNVETNFSLGLEGLRRVLGAGFEKELEYHAVYALHYGEILALCKRGEKRKEILNRIIAYETAYPEYFRNPYLKNMGTAKRMFLMAQRMRMVFALRVFAKLHGLYVH